MSRRLITIRVAVADVARMGQILKAAESAQAIDHLAGTTMSQRFERLLNLAARHVLNTDAVQLGGDRKKLRK